MKFRLDRQKPVINSEAVTKSVPRGFLKVTLLEDGMKFSFVLIAILRYFRLSSKQIMSILRKFLSSRSHLIVKLDWNRIPPWESEDFYGSLIWPVPTCWADVIKHFTFHSYYNSTVNLPGVILLFKIGDASGERKYLITASNLTELTLTINKVVRTYFWNFLLICFI